MENDIDELKRRAEALHKQTMVLWQRYQQLNRQALAFQADIVDFLDDIRKQGKKIYELRQETGNLLND